MSKKTRQVQVGSVRIGGGAPVSVQSMTNTDTADVEKTLSQIRALTVAGADIVRVSVYNEACADAVLAQPALPGSVLFDKGYDCSCDDHFRAAHPDTDWRVCLEHGEKLGIGTRDYELIKI